MTNHVFYKIEWFLKKIKINNNLKGNIFEFPEFQSPSNRSLIYKIGLKLLLNKRKSWNKLK